MQGNSQAFLTKTIWYLFPRIKSTIKKNQNLLFKKGSVTQKNLKIKFINSRV